MLGNSYYNMITFKPRLEKKKKERDVTKVFNLRKVDFEGMKGSEGSQVEKYTITGEHRREVDKV